MAAGTVEWSKLCSSTSKIKCCPLTTWPHDGSDQCFQPKRKSHFYFNFIIQKIFLKAAHISLFLTE